MASINSISSLVHARPRSAGPLTPALIRAAAAVQRPAAPRVEVFGEGRVQVLDTLSSL